MVRISIIKKQGNYTYKYYMVDINNRPFYVTKSGFKTPEEALKAAKESYNRRVRELNKNINPFHVTKKKSIHIDMNKIKPLLIKNLQITDGGCRLLRTATVGVVIVVVGFASAKIIKKFEEKFVPTLEETVEDKYYQKEIITPSNCNFKDLHVILRTAKQGTAGVSSVTSDMLTKLGVSNEIVTQNSNLSERIEKAFDNHKESNIVVINLETGYENTGSNNTIIMGDSSNKRKYPSDILASCIKASLKEYSLSPYIRSGMKKNLWRNQSYIEKELSDSILINKVSQLTIDLPLSVSSDQLIRNDAASSIVEGIMRWTTIDPTERYKNIYYTTEYGDTIDSVATEYAISIDDIKKYSDVNMRKGMHVGNTVLVSPLPNEATENVIVDNPYTTTYPDAIKQVLKEYIVQSGDTINGIANKYGVKTEDIIVEGNPNKISVGETVYIVSYNLYETHGKTDIKEKVLEK